MGKQGPKGRDIGRLSEGGGETDPEQESGEREEEQEKEKEVIDNLGS